MKDSRIIIDGKVKQFSTPNIFPLRVVRKRWYHNFIDKFLPLPKKSVKLCSITISADLNCTAAGKIFIDRKKG